MCEDWFHGKCVNVTKAMGQEMEESGIEWRCPNCVRKTKQPSGKPSQKVGSFTYFCFTYYYYFFSGYQKTSFILDFYLIIKRHFKTIFVLFLLPYFLLTFLLKSPHFSEKQNKRKQSNY